MIAAVSADVASTPAADTRESASYHWIKTMPDLNRATKRRLGQSGAGWTFTVICSLVHHVGRVGRPQARKAAKELGRLGVGLQAIADEAGISVAKVRRDLVKLVDLGLVAVSRRNVTFKTDPATGKITENRTGRSLPVTVFLTIGPEHCRTKAGQDRPGNPAKQEPSNPAKLEGPGLHDRDHSGGAIQRDFNTERTPVGLAAGVGQPQAAQEAGQPQAAQEATQDDLPPSIGRISRPAGQAASPRPGGRRTPLPEDHREPQAFSGIDAERLEATRRRLEAEAEKRRLEDQRWRQEAEERLQEGKAVA